MRKLTCIRGYPLCFLWVLSIQPLGEVGILSHIAHIRTCAVVCWLMFSNYGWEGAPTCQFPCCKNSHHIQYDIIEQSGGDSNTQLSDRNEPAVAHTGTVYTEVKPLVKVTRLDCGKQALKPRCHDLSCALEHYSGYSHVNGRASWAKSLT